MGKSREGGQSYETAIFLRPPEQVTRTLREIVEDPEYDFLNPANSKRAEIIPKSRANVRLLKLPTTPNPNGINSYKGKFRDFPGHKKPNFDVGLSHFGLIDRKSPKKSKRLVAFFDHESTEWLIERHDDLYGFAVEQGLITDNIIYDPGSGFTPHIPIADIKEWAVYHARSFVREDILLDDLIWSCNALDIGVRTGRGSAFNISEKGLIQYKKSGGTGEHKPPRKKEIRKSKTRKGPGVKIHHIVIGVNLGRHMADTVFDQLPQASEGIDYVAADDFFLPIFEGTVAEHNLERVSKALSSFLYMKWEGGFKKLVWGQPNTQDKYYPLYLQPDQDTIDHIKNMRVALGRNIGRYIRETLTEEQFAILVGHISSETKVLMDKPPQLLVGHAPIDRLSMFLDSKIESVELGFDRISELRRSFAETVSGLDDIAGHQEIALRTLKDWDRAASWRTGRGDPRANGFRLSRDGNGGSPRQGQRNCNCQ